MKILAIGDLTEPRSALFLKNKLPNYKKEHSIDFVLANAENAGSIMGPTPETARMLLENGVDVITGGNHTLQNKYLYQMLDYQPRLLRPCNYPQSTYGHGDCIVTVNKTRILCMNAMGQVHIEPTLDSPYTAIENILKRNAGKYDISILDFHAEPNGEKYTLAHYFDGRITAIYGTHTHVPTADEQILPKGTGYISDIGMTGGSTGILGLDPKVLIDRTLKKIAIKSEPDNGPIVACGVVFTLDDQTKKVISVERIKIE